MRNAAAPTRPRQKGIGGSMTDNITDAIASSAAQSAGYPDLVEALSKKIPVGRLHSVLLSTYERRSRDMSASDVLRRAADQDIVRASPLDQRTLLELDRILLTAVDRSFEAVELSPFCTFGLNAVLTNTSQKKIFSADRGTEALSDLATALALEAAMRRSSHRADGLVKLCSSHRLARAQKYPPGSGFTPHFRMFCLFSAQNHGFNAGACMADHVDQYLSFFAAANRQAWHIERLTITLSDLSITERLLDHHGMDRTEIGARTLAPESRLFAQNAPFAMTLDDPSELGADVRQAYRIDAQVERLARIGDALRVSMASHPIEVTVRFAVDRIGGLGHYDGLCFKIDGLNAAGRSYPLVDGGNTSWLQTLLANRKERCFVSGMGTEIFHRFYQKTG
jgi:hypothetical protein